MDMDNDTLRKNRQHVRLEPAHGLTGQLQLVEVRGNAITSRKRPVQIINISLGGLRMETSLRLPLMPDYVLQLELVLAGLALRLRGKPVWARQQSEGYAYGITFIPSHTSAHTSAHSHARWHTPSHTSSHTPLHTSSQITSQPMRSRLLLALNRLMLTEKPDCSRIHHLYQQATWGWNRQHIKLDWKAGEHYGIEALFEGDTQAGLAHYGASSDGGAGSRDQEYVLYDANLSGKREAAGKPGYS